MLGCTHCLIVVVSCGGQISCDKVSGLSSPRLDSPHHGNFLFLTKGGNTSTPKSLDMTVIYGRKQQVECYQCRKSLLEVFHCM